MATFAILKHKVRNKYFFIVFDLICAKIQLLSHPTNSNRVQIVLWELLAADIKRVEGIGAVGAVLQEVFLGFWLLLHTLVLAEAVAPSLHSGGLDGEDKVVIVLAVEVRHETLLAGETLIDKEVLFIVAHGVAEIHVNHLPTVTLKLVTDYPVEVLVVHGIVGAEGGGIVVVDDRLVWDAARSMCRSRQRAQEFCART